MSGNRRKSTPKKPAEAVEEPVSARVVAIPKNPENGGAKPAESKVRGKSERIGDILRAARVERNDDLYQIAEYLCIKPAFLVALENSRYDEFPADAYVIGFLRSYANFLGVDGKDAVDRYRYEMAGRRKKPILSMPIPLTEGRAPSALIMVGATVAVLLIYALWYGISSANRTEVNVPPPLPPVQQLGAASTDTPTAAAGLTAPMDSSAADTAPAPVASAPTPQPAPVSAATNALIPPAAPGIMVTAAEPAAKPDTTILGKEVKDTDAKSPDMKAPDVKKVTKDKDADAVTVPDAKDDKKDDKKVFGDPDEAAHIIIRATQSAWVQVDDASGKTLFDHVLKAGDIYKVPNKTGLTLTTGNGGGLVVSADGVEMPKVATGAPHVVRDIPLDPERLTAEPSAQ